MPDEKRRREKREEELFRRRESGLPLSPILDMDFLIQTKTLIRRSWNDEWREETPSPFQTTSSRCFIRGEDIGRNV